MTMFKLLALACGLAAAPAPLATVPKVELERYLGTWYEIARYPNWFQKGCDSATARYRLLPDGGIEVLNTCLKPDGKEKQALGKAEVMDKQGYARLRVSFVPAWLRWTGVGWGDYWIVDLDSDYKYAVVSEPGRKYLWILNREPVMKRETYDKILGRLKELDLDPAKLISSGPGRLEAKP